MSVATKSDRATVALKLITVLAMVDVLTNPIRKRQLLASQNEARDVLLSGDEGTADDLAQVLLVLGFQLLKQEGHDISNPAIDALIEERARGLIAAADAQARERAAKAADEPAINVPADTNLN